MAKHMATHGNTTMEYLDRHQRTLEQAIGRAMEQTLREQPENPVLFCAERMIAYAAAVAKKADEGTEGPVMSDEASMTERLAGRSTTR